MGQSCRGVTLQTGQIRRGMSLSSSRGTPICASGVFEILGRNDRDIPFALVYLSDRSGKVLNLAGHAGLALPGQILWWCERPHCQAASRARRSEMEKETLADGR
jgi:hypothetical protein